MYGGRFICGISLALLVGCSDNSNWLEQFQSQIGDSKSQAPAKVQPTTIETVFEAEAVVQAVRGRVVQYEINGKKRQGVLGLIYVSAHGTTERYLYPEINEMPDSRKYITGPDCITPDDRIRIKYIPMQYASHSRIKDIIFPPRKDIWGIEQPQPDIIVDSFRDPNFKGHGYITEVIR